MFGIGRSCFILAMGALLLSLTTEMARAEGSSGRRFVSLAAAAAGSAMGDSGLEHRFHIAVGHWSGLGNSGIAAKGDLTLFRPTRHEAVATLWYLHDSSGSLVAGTAEYRWRFGGHGIAYYGAGLGAGQVTTGESGGVATFGLGVDLGQFTLESRSMSGSGGAIGMFLVGYRY